MRPLLLSSWFAVTLLATSTARALDPNVAVLAGYGYTVTIEDGMPVGYNAGLGVRGGLTLPVNFYLGGTFVYHLGAHRGDDASNVWYVGGEGGYDITVGRATIRPYVGLGYGHLRVKARHLCSLTDCGRGVTHAGSLAIWPGLSVLGDVGRQFFVGGDLRYVILNDLFEGDSPGIFFTVGRHL